MSPSERARERRLLTELSRINNEYGVKQRSAMQELARSRRELASAQGAHGAQRGLGMVAADLRAPVDVLALVDDLVSRYQVMRAESGVEVRARRTATEGPRPQVLGDEVRLQRVLESLVTDAVVLSPDAVVVTVTVALEGDSVVISVTDDSPAIPPGQHAGARAPDSTPGPGPVFTLRLPALLD